METRTDLINHYVKTRGYKSFLEIGTADGANFRAVECERKVCVDPDPEAKATYCTTSDEFFSEVVRPNAKFDIVFVDGFHEWSQALRDVKNSLRHLKKGGVIVMHDCHPVSEECARHMDRYVKPEGAWCGDVWKAFVRLRSLVPFEMFVWDHDFGCGVVDTSKQASVKAEVPEDVRDLTYADFLDNPHWMNFRESVQ